MFTIDVAKWVIRIVRIVKSLAHKEPYDAMWECRLLLATPPGSGPTGTRNHWFLSA